MSTEATDSTVDDLRARLLAERLGGRARGRRQGIGRVDRGGPLPLSHGQEQMWFLNRLEPDSAEYLVPLAVRLRGPLDTTVLHRSWGELLARHEVLRTRYELAGDAPVQLIDPPGRSELMVTDLSALEPDKREPHARLLAETDLAAPFDLAREWPVRARLVRLSDDDHLLLVSFHHIACDAWSVGVLVRELSELYRGASLAELPVQYADFAAWQRTSLDQAHLAYWREQLAGLEPSELPVDHPRPARRSWQGAHVPLRFDAERVRSLARQHRVTPFMVLLTAYQVLLARYTGQTDVPVGTVGSGRGRPELQGVVGYGINSLVLRGRWDGDPTFGELLDRTRATVMAAYDHQDVPFTKLVDELQPERDMSRTPLFQAAFTMHESRTGAFDLPGVEAEPLHSDQPVAKFELTLQVEEDTLAGHLEYVAALFEPATVERMARHLTEIVGNAGSDVPLSALLRSDPSVLSGQDEPLPGGTLADAFEAQAARTPDAVALVHEHVQLTYRELNEQANRHAHRLVAAGVGPDVVVAVSLPRSIDLVVALLAVLKAGGAHLPVDPDLPEQRREFMITDAGARLVLAELTDPADDVGNPVRGTRSGDVAYVVYTSGSTGTPKGVLCTHESVLNRVVWTQHNYYRLDTTDVVLHKTPIGFDVSMSEFFSTLTTGARLVLANPGDHRDPQALRATIIRHGVTQIHFVPSMLAAFLAQDGVADCTSLRLVVSGGEDLSAALAGKLLATLPGTELYNQYGPSEAAIDVTAWRCPPGFAGKVPIGTPLQNVRLYVLDDALRPVPAGARGELYIAGAALARGYLNRPALTAERFLPDPFGPGRMYRTGDVARVGSDGQVEYLGRIDDQVKFHGVRIELGEIEAALTAHPKVAAAAAAIKDDRLVGYFVPADGVSAAELKAALVSHLPEYLVPSALVELDRIPLNANGKLDRKALPAVTFTAEGTAPRTVAEEHIAAVWCDVLGLDAIGVHDSFFDLGGDSIRAVALVGALREAGFDVAVRDVFEHRTVARLTELATGRPAAVPEPPVRPFALISAQDREKLPAGVADAYPLSQVQAGMVVEMLADTDTRAYHMVTTFRVRDADAFDLARLQRGVDEVLARHEILRTSFDLENYSVPLQLVHARATTPVALHDLRGMNEEQVEHALRDFTAREHENVLDLTAAPLLRVAAHICDDDSWWLSISSCHAILEGWSSHSMLMEIVGGYRGETHEPLPEVRFADFVAGELASLESTEDRAYWQGIVGRHPALTLPAWGDDGPAEVYERWIPITDLEPALRTVATGAGVSLKAVLHAAHLKVMSQLTDEPRFFSALVTSARPEVAGADRVYGMYLNSLPFAHDRSARTWRELVRQVFDREVEMWPHRRFPMPAIYHEMGAGDRLVDVRFSYRDFHQVDAGRIDYGSTINEGVTEFPCAVAASPDHVSIKVNSTALSRAHTERLAGMYRAVLEAMAANPDGDARRTYLPADERRTQLVTWNTTSREPIEHSVLDLFEQQAALHPDAVALTYRGERVSYAELDAEANRFAHLLRGKGIGAESVVGVLLDRSPRLVACLLGVWKTGGAYLPIDPSYPAERVGYMLTNAGAGAVVTEPRHRAKFTEHLVVDLEDLAGRPDTPVGHRRDLDGLAYVIYTSGSTGRPKGVQVTRRGLANHVVWAAAELASRGTGGAPLFSSVAFDLVVPNLYAPLVTGQPVHLVDQDVELADLGAALVERGPFSFIKLTPGHLDVLIHQLGAEQAGQLANLVLVAGEAFTRRTVDGWRALAPNLPLVNEYGPTEASVGTCIHPVHGPAPEVVPIGKPLPGMTMYVLDANLQPVPVGVTGELYVGGTGVARGYANQPELTAERFLPNPHGAPGERFYRTGDLVRALPSGDVEFLGRIDHQVKVRGYRIELGEIQTVLAEHPGVAEAVVIADGESSEERRLLGYFVPSGDTAEQHELAAHCARVLPDYMVPVAFVALDRIPLNANGKVDRAALPAPERAATTRTSTAPRTETEERLAEVWRDVLGLAEIGVDDSFFELGGNSIRVLNLIAAMRTKGFEASVRDVFTHRTVAGLASALGRTSAEQFRAAQPFELISPQDRENLPADVVDAYPLSQVQLGMVVELLTDESRGAYHNVSAFLIRDEQPVDLGALAAAAAIVVERHEVFRTSIDLDSYAVPMQLVHATAQVPVALHDLRTVPQSGTEAAVRDFIAEQRAAVFDVARAPLWRVNAVVVADDAWFLSFTLHHAVIEGWSHHSLLMELLDTYERLRDGEQPAEHEPPGVRYADFVAAELQALRNEDDREYWRELVQDNARFTLPAEWGDPATPVVPSRATTTLHHLRDGLHAVAAEAGVSVKAVMLAAHLKVLSQLTNEERFLTGLVSHGRVEAVGADRVYGMHLNTLPFAHDRSARTWRELVVNVHAQESRAWEHRHFPLPEVQRLAGGGRLLDVLFSYLEFPQVDQEKVDGEASLHEAPTEFVMNVSTVAGWLHVTTSSNLVSRHNVERIAQMHRLVLEDLVADLDGDARRTFLAGDERELVLHRWNDTDEPQAGHTLHEPFERWAEVQPDAVAVVCGDQEVTYAELNVRANRLAHRLRERGAGPDVVVAVRLERSVELVVAALAVAKTGAAYLPIDPDYPQARADFMLADAGAEIVLTEVEPCADQPSANLPTVHGPDDISFIIYTSGSTGQPKGAPNTYAGLCNRLDWTQRTYHQLGPADVVLQKAPIAFDVSMWELFGPLMNGARLVVAEPGGHRDPAYLVDVIVEHGVTQVHFVNSVLGLVLNEPRIAECRTLRRVVCGGEEMSATSARRLMRTLPGCTLYNQYGPSEASIDVTAWHVTPEGLAAGGRVPFGGPMANVQLYVLDRAMQPVPIGVPGELFIGGVALARGYLNLPHLTAERFLPNPFHSGRMYRTGDLARWRTDGTLEFAGRADQQVKVRGVRIELGEVEAALLAHPDVREALAIVREDRLVAYVAGEAGDLRAWLTRTLPETMVPSAFVVLDRIPRFPSGKLDRAALPAPEGGTAGTSYVAPRTEIERQVAQVWQQVLGVADVGAEDNFFDLGGDSIRAVTLVGAMRRAGFDVTVRDVFAHRTVDALASHLAVHRQAPEQVALTERFALISAQDREKLPADVVDAYPVSQVQLGMVVEMLAGSGRNAYHNVTALRIRDDAALDLTALRKAAELVVARHEVFRTSFHLDGYSVPLQLVHAGVTVPVEQSELTGADLVAAERAKLFDVRRAPLMRVTAAQDGERTWWLAVTQAHAVTQGWGHQQLLTELITGYRAFRDGTAPPPRAETAVRYADFIAAEQAALSSVDDQTYWRGVVEEHARFEPPAGWGDEHTGEATRARIEISDELREFATAEGVSLKSVLHAAHLKVLSQLTGEQRFHSGLVTDARPELPGAEHVQGMHLNTVPFRHDRGARTWRELVRQVFDREVELWPHRAFPLPAVQRLAGTPRLLEVMFSYHDFRRQDTGPVEVEAGIGAGASEFALSAVVQDGHLSLIARPEVFGQAGMKRLTGMYRAVLAAMAADPDGNAAQVYLPAGEAEQLLSAGDTAVEPVTERVHEAFEAQVRRTPHAVAVVFGDVELTYAELNERANRLAHHLIALGAGPEQLVGLAMQRSAELVVALLGILKSGAAYLPLDPAQPADRLGFMLTDAAARIVVTTSGHEQALAEIHDGALVLLDDVDLTGMPAENPQAQGTPDNLIYVIYTSGSTGRPKGVCLSHANVLRLLTTAQEHYAFDETDVWPLFHSYAFDVSVWEMWGALLFGGRLVVVPREVTRSPEDMLDLLVRHEVTVLNQTPSAFRGLIAAARDGDERIGRLSLRAVVFAGEKLEISELRPWVERVGLARVALVNMYGITETTVHTTYHRVLKRDLAGTANPIGRPLSDLRVHVLDQQGNLAPLGVVGEIHVGGPGVARGYLNRPELTAQRFVPDPFGTPGARLYRSGDLARRMPDGTLEFHGRIDDQVKIRGYRIELGEIQARLTEMPGVRDAVVLAVDGRLIAYVVGETAGPREELGRSLPEYMVPSAFVALDAFPLTVNGKLDKRALPAPSAEEGVAPRTTVEERIAAVWASVLGVGTVGVEDGFFDLGGDSIMAVSLVGALRADGFDLAVRDVLEQRTVAGLAQLVTGRPAAAEFEPVAPFALISAADLAALPGGVEDAYPVSQVQTGMVLEMLADGGRNAYHSVGLYPVPDDGDFSFRALRQAVQTVLDRHEVLRTSFDFTSFSTPLQLVNTEVEPVVRMIDAHELEPAQVERALHDLVAAERAELFDLDTAPLLRVTALVRGPREWWVAVTQCHAITEGWSQHTLLAELLDCYRAYREDTEPEETEPPRVRYADFIAGELESLASPADRAHWQSVVDGWARFSLPRWGGGEPQGYRVRVPYHDLADRLRQHATEAKVSFKSVLHAVHLKVLSQLTEEQEFCTGLVVDARPEAAGADRVHGMYLNTLPFPHDRGARTWRELVRQVFDREVELWPHRRFPLPAVHRLAGASRLLEVMFSYQDYSRFSSGDGPAPAGGTGDGATEFPLAVIAQNGSFTLSTSTGVLSRANADRLAAMYRAVAEAMAQDLDGDAARTYLPAADLAVVAAARPIAEPQVLRVHEAFEAQVERTPQAIALVCGDVELTYAELNERANRLAHHLIMLGAGRETLVGVSLERGADLVPALLGVLKAGAAYVPLDPANPVDRTAFVLADTGTGLLVTDSSRFTGGFGGTIIPPERADGPAHNPDVPGSPDDLIYVIYTSGSTGKPKGVCLSHTNVLRLLTTAQEHYEFAETDVWPLFHSYAFDVSVWEMWGALLHGGRLVVVPAEVTRSPDDFLDLLVRHQVTVLNQTPSAFRGLIAAARDGDERIDRLALRAVVFAGEKLEFPDLQPWVDRLGLDRPVLANMYGITETTVHTTYYRVVPEDVPGTGGNPVGVPLRDLQVHLLDQQGALVPLGVVGEIHVGGPGVARGYLNRPELTAQRFVPDPFGTPGARLYRSGDLARRMPDGSLEFHGRIDDQVKIRGYRIELGEISATLADQPGVREAVVLAREGRLVAYVVGEPAGDLRTALSRTLPEYMVPAAFVRLDALPLTTNGKLDKRALPAPDRESLSTRRAYEEPKAGTEQVLAGIWAAVLDVPRIGRHDRFAELGGHSILLVQVISAARKAGLQLELSLFYRNDTIAELAAALDRPVAGATGDPFAELREAMQCNGVPGASAALVEGGEVVAVAGLGVVGAGGGEVTPETRFQVGSISKLVTALAVLRLVGEGTLALDVDVNAYLRSWRMPDGEPVTVRRLLSHRSGLTSPARRDLPITGLLAQVELGEQRFRRADIHFTALQQLLTDVTGTGFADLVTELVLQPLGMADSGFEPGPLPARGHHENGAEVDGGWQTRTELAASGLWSTARDLAAVTLEVQRALAGAGAVLTPPLALEMVTEAEPGSFYGLGTNVDRTGTQVGFGHGGEVTGYRAMAAARLPAGTGFVVLTNSAAGKAVISRLLDAR